MITPTIVICAWCRQQCRPVNDQHGWRPATVEEIAQQNVSHGMCPKCSGTHIAPFRQRHEVKP